MRFCYQGYYEINWPKPLRRVRLRCHCSFDTLLCDGMVNILAGVMA
jgi:hypothetical protein